MMLRAIVVAAALALTATAVQAQKIDANGRCHDANGQFAKAEVCGGASTSKSASTTKTTTTKSTTTKTAKSATAAAAPAAATAAAPANNHCRDKTTKKMAKCSAPNTEPLPAKAK